MPPDIMVSPASLPAPAGSAPGTTTPGKTATGPPGTDALSALFASLLAQSSTAPGTLPKTGVLNPGSQKNAVSVMTEKLKSAEKLKTTGNSKTMDTDPVHASLPQEKKSTTGDELLLPHTQADVPVAAPLPGLPTPLLPVLVALTPAVVTPMPVLAAPLASITPSLASVTPLVTALPMSPGKSQAVIKTLTPLPGLPLSVSTQPLEARASALVTLGTASSSIASSAASGLPLVALSASAPQELIAAPTPEIALPRTFALNSVSTPMPRSVLSAASQVLTQALSVSNEKSAPNLQATAQVVPHAAPQGPSAPAAEALLKTQITSQALTAQVLTSQTPAVPQSPSPPNAQAVLAATTSADANTAGDRLAAVSNALPVVASPKPTPSAIAPQTVPANTAPPAAAPTAAVNLSPATPSINSVAVTLVAANPVIASAVMATTGAGLELPNVSGKPADKTASSTSQNSTLQNSTPNGLKSAATSADTQTVINTGSITAGKIATTSVEKKPTTDSLLAVGAKRSTEKLGSKDQSDPEITQTGTAAPITTEIAKTATPSLTAADRAAIVQQVADGVGAMPVPKVPGTPEQMTLQLHPKDWGKLHISVTLTPGPDAGSARTVTAHIVADTPQVKAALESGQGELHQTLREAGLHLEHLTVSVKPAEFKTGEVKSASDSAPSGMPFDQSRQDAGGGFSQGSAGQGTSGQGAAGQTPDTPSSLSSGGNGTPSFASFAGGHPGGRQGQSSPAFAGTSYRAEPEPDTVPVWNAATRSVSGRIDLHA